MFKRQQNRQQNNLLRHNAGEEGDDADLEAPKIYEPIESFEQLEEKLKVFQEQYNETIRGSKMDLVFFKVYENVDL